MHTNQLGFQPRQNQRDPNNHPSSDATKEIPKGIITDTILLESDAQFDIWEKHNQTTRHTNPNI